MTHSLCELLIVWLVAVLIHWLVHWFLQVCAESMRFEKLMEHFKNEDDNIDFMVCISGPGRQRCPTTALWCNHPYSLCLLWTLWSCWLCWLLWLRWLGSLYAVHQHRGPLRRRHELQSPPAVWLHQAGSGWPPRGIITLRVHIMIFVLLTLCFFTCQSGKNLPAMWFL